MARFASGAMDLVPELTDWRRDIHAHPELAFREHRTAAVVSVTQIHGGDGRVGAANVDPAPVPTMGAEDFAFMLQQRPGCYVWIGNGPAEDGRNLHSPRYDFNDAVLPYGVSYWVELVEQRLPA